MKYNKQTGIDGETLAAAYLSEIGYIILHMNWRYKYHEVDIIARDGDMIVFVEVKTRTSQSYGRPEDFVDNRKVSSLMQAADEYLQRFKEPTELRFDIVSVIMDRASGTHEVEHFEDAFYHG